MFKDARELDGAVCEERDGGARKSPIFYDDEVIGFGLQVRYNGRKTFPLDNTFGGRRQRYFIGDYPA